MYHCWSAGYLPTSDPEKVEPKPKPPKKKATAKTSAAPKRKPRTVKKK